MRAVSFVSRFELEFKGNLAKNALCLGDADNDGDCELIVGNLQGDLAVFKGQNAKPPAKAQDLGMIQVVVVGDILNEKRNNIICISGEGICTIFEMKSSDRALHSIHVQRLPANTKVALLADVDGDGDLELVLGLTDHVLRTYRWVKINQGDEVTGKLVGLHKLELADQIGSISLNPCPEGGPPDILVAQSGGTYINFQCCADDDCGSQLTTPVHHPVASSRMRNPNISSEILGGISGTHRRNPLIAVATLDGTLMLVDGDETLWSFQVDHQLFALTKLDLVGDGEEEVIACAWDGQTYMVNQEKQSVRFQFEEPVTAFTAGEYSVCPGERTNVLVYGTFNDRILVYHDIHLPAFRIPTFLEVAADPLFHEVIGKGTEMRSVLSNCLYDFPPNKS